MPSPPPIPVPPQRIRALSDAALRPSGRYVLYWQVANRRTRYNFALQHAVAMAVELGRPLVVLEPLRLGYAHASPRIHSFILDGMRETHAAYRAAGVTVHSYVESIAGQGHGLLAALAAEACLVVTDDSPQFFVPRMQAKAAQMLDVRLDAVDSVGLLPQSAAGRTFFSAHSLRSFLQVHLPPFLDAFPLAAPLGHLPPQPTVQLPAGVAARWPDAWTSGIGDRVGSLQFAASVPVVDLRGGQVTAGECLQAFIQRLQRYPEDRNHPDRQGPSGLSPYLHFGHISAHEVFAAVAHAEAWGPQLLRQPNRGAREGWWNMSPAAEAFVDQLVTWRELGHLEARFRENYSDFETLPAWALQTLSAHAADVRPTRYTLEQLELAMTHDLLWNAAQRQLTTTGVLHNYLRMLWGKKILEWTDSPPEALQTMLYLNDKYALDGRDPNSVSGIFWVLGRYDRAWGPERPIFGTIRYMSSDNTARKVELKRYLRTYGTVQPMRLDLG